MRTAMGWESISAGNVRGLRRGQYVIRTAHLHLRGWLRAGAMAMAGLLVLAVALLGWLEALPGGGPAGAVTASVSPSPGCRAGGPVTPGSKTTIPFSAAGRDGSYVLQVPTSYSRSHPLPVVFDLHGYAEPATLQVSISGLGEYGQAHHFITVTPGVNEPVPLWESVVGSQDMAFFGALLSHVEHTVCVDQHRVYATGYSNGAFMSSAIACQFAGKVAAVAPVAGIQADPHCKPSRPVPVVAFHGTADPFVNFNGGAGAKAASLPAPNGQGSLSSSPSQAAQIAPSIGLSIPTDAARWAARNRCASKPSTTKVTSDVSLISYKCPSDASVELYVVHGGGHAWPGSRGSAAIGSIVGRTTFSISADKIMWRFFQEHPLTPSD